MSSLYAPVFFVARTSPPGIFMDFIASTIPASLATKFGRMGWRLPAHHDPRFSYSLKVIILAGSFFHTLSFLDAALRVRASHSVSW